MSVEIDGTLGITSPGGDSSAVDVTTPKVKNAGTLALEATGENIITFATNGSEAARFDSDRNFLVGTTSAIDILSGSNDGATIASSGVINSSQNGASSLRLRRRSNDGAVAIFSRDTSLVGNISVTTTATSYNTSSDYRLKENLTPITGALARVAQIPVYRFNFKADPDKTVDGFVAHELAPHIPEAVTGEKDGVETVEIKDDEGKVTGTEERPVYQGVDQSKPVPLLTAAIQELLEEVNTLKARIEQLENQ